SKCMSWVLGALLHANNTQAGRNECYGVVNFKVLCPVQIDAKAHAHSRETSKQDYICQVFLLVHSRLAIVFSRRSWTSQTGYITRRRIEPRGAGDPLEDLKIHAEYHRNGF
ncbi:hypothetical protein VOLCADRAFT_101482, partial [Volvox carteri f. nagariensis]